MVELINETGNRYGLLTVLGRSVYKHSGSTMAYWVCECDCGSFSRPAGAALRNGNSTSCGCGRRQGRRFEKGKAAFNSLYANYERSAKKREHKFGIPKEDFRRITEQTCYYCGVEPRMSHEGTRTNGAYIYNGLDRIDNNNGYVPDNVVPCCGDCNHAKRFMTPDKFMDWVERVSEHQYCI